MLSYQKVIMINTAVLCQLCLLFICTGSALATTYWVSPTGTAANLAACSGSTPLSGTSACSYSKANGSGVVAGDTVYYRAGTYTGITGAFINPYNTGTAGNIITFSAYNGEDVQVTSSVTNSIAVNLNSDYGTVRSYIKVHDLHFSNFMQHLWILKGHHNEISYCSFIGYPPTATQADFVGNFQASYIYRQAQYNWIHHCKFGLWGYNATYGNDNGGVFGMGVESSTTDNTRYNLVENNEMYGGGHHVAYLNGSYNIYRNNYFHNEPWYPLTNPIFSTRIIAQEGYPGDGMYNLNEGNRIAYGGPKNKDEIGGSGGQVKGAYNIWRRNIYTQIYTNAIYMTKYVGQSDVKYNKIYNNTFWHGGFGTYQLYPSGTAPSANWDDRYAHAIVVEEGSDGASIYGNIIKNNIFYQNRDPLGTQYSVISKYYSSSTGWVTRVPAFQTVFNNWFDNAGDPKFVDITGAPDPTNGNQWDFHLQKSSPCIDTGSFLTTITSSSGSGTSFTVTDAGYFWFDVGGMKSNISGASIASGDTIQLQGQSQKAVITNINYVTNTITVNTPLSWSQGQGISLAYNGSAPDKGAFESLAIDSPIITNFAVSK
jgi:hypothetical protein